MKKSNGKIKKIKKSLTVSRKILNKISLKEKELQVILDSAPAAIFYKDNNNRFMQVNKVFAKLMQIPKSKLEGMSLFDLFPKAQAEQYFRDDKEVIKSGKPKTNIVESIHTKKGILWVRTDKVPYRNRDGKITGVIGFVVDITKEKDAEDTLRRKMNELQEKDQRLFDSSEELLTANEELKNAKDELESVLRQVEAQREFTLQEKNRLEAIIDGMGEGVLVINEDKEIEIMNDKLKTIMGYNPNNEIPIGYKKFFVLQLWKELQESKKGIVTKEITLHRPQEIIMQITLAGVPKSGANDKTEFVAVIRDITIEKKIDKMKSDFVANVAHEIRSPMAPMKEAINLIADGTAGPVTENQRKMLSIVQNNSDRLLRLINDLLDLSKIQSGKLEIRKERLNIMPLIKDTIESVNLHARTKEIEISVESGGDIPDINCDKDRITQVIINLLMNAVKFTPEKRKIKVTVTMTPVVHDVKYVKVSVADTGPGMTKEESEGLFNRFRQLDSTEKIKGTGLGLSISKGIIEMHGGHIWAESEPGKGSVFNFTLPVE